MKSQNKKKDSIPTVLKKEDEGHRLIQDVHVREASKEEASQIEQTLDRLLTELAKTTKQARAQGEKK